MIQSPICHLEVGTLPEWRQAPSLLSPQFLLRSTLREACASQVAVPQLQDHVEGCTLVGAGAIQSSLV